LNLSDETIDRALNIGQGLLLIGSVIGGKGKGGASAAANAEKQVVNAGEATTKETRFIDGVAVVDRKTGSVYVGTVDLKPTLDRIETGEKYPHVNDGSIFKNNQSLLPIQPQGYYSEYVVPTGNIKGVGPQRIVAGKRGEMYYTPDHYKTFIKVK
jgi:filamentous hemagglutinin